MEREINNKQNTILRIYLPKRTELQNDPVTTPHPVTTSASSGTLVITTPPPPLDSSPPTITFHTFLSSLHSIATFLVSISIHVGYYTLSSFHCS